MAAPQAHHDNYYFATELRTQRGKAGLTQVGLAEATMKLGHPISQGLISQYETGTSGVSFERVVVLERALKSGNALRDAWQRDVTSRLDELRGSRRSALAAA